MCPARARRWLCYLKCLNAGSHRSEDLPIGPNRTVVFSAGLNINLHDEQGDNNLSYYTPGTDIRPETKDRKFFLCLSGPILWMVPLLSDFTEYLGSTQWHFFSKGVQTCGKKSWIYTFVSMRLDIFLYWRKYIMTWMSIFLFSVGSVFIAGKLNIAWVITECILFFYTVL